MYRDLCHRFWWTRMKRDIARYVAECDVCRRIKAEHQDLLVHFNLCLFPSGNGTKSAWTSSPAFQKPREETMLSLLLSIDSQKLLTSFQSASLLLPVS